MNYSVRRHKFNRQQQQKQCASFTRLRIDPHKPLAAAASAVGGGVDGTKLLGQQILDDKTTNTADGEHF